MHLLVIRLGNARHAAVQPAAAPDAGRRELTTGLNPVHLLKPGPVRRDHAHAPLLAALQVGHRERQTLIRDGVAPFTKDVLDRLSDAKSGRIVLRREVPRGDVLDADPRHLTRQGKSAGVLEPVVALVRGAFVFGDDALDDSRSGLVPREHLLYHLRASFGPRLGLRGGGGVQLTFLVQARLLTQLLSLGLGLLRLDRCAFLVELGSLDGSLEVIELAVQSRLLVPRLLLRLLLVVHVAFVQLGDLELQLLNLRVRRLHRGHNLRLSFGQIVNQLASSGEIRLGLRRLRRAYRRVLPIGRRRARVHVPPDLLAGRRRSPGQRGRIGRVVELLKRSGNF